METEGTRERCVGFSFEADPPLPTNFVTTVRISFRPVTPLAAANGDRLVLHPPAGQQGWLGLGLVTGVMILTVSGGYQSQNLRCSL